MAAATMVPIRGTFDIALARKTLRSQVASRKWPSHFNAKAAAGLTALGELILLPCMAKMAVIRMTVIEAADGGGIEFSCPVKFISEDFTGLQEAQDRLDRAMDELDIVQTPDGFQISGSIWVA